MAEDSAAGTAAAHLAQVDAALLGDAAGERRSANMAVRGRRSISVCSTCRRFLARGSDS
jgi:hypothetical protein